MYGRKLGKNTITFWPVLKGYLFKELFFSRMWNR